jgi:hypothetical protein
LRVFSNKLKPLLGFFGFCAVRHIDVSFEDISRKHL